MRRFLPTCLGLTTLCGCSDNLTLPPERAPYEPEDPVALDCVPNLDESIAADELPVGFGVDVSYSINPAGETRSVDLVGLVDQDGVRVWDYSQQNASDRELQIAATELGEQWYATEFPGADFIAPLDAAGRIDGVYRRTDNAVLLLGYASRKEAPEVGQTLVVYQQPVTVYQLPLEPGDSWVSVGEVTNATVQDLPYAGRDTYSVEVDSVGELWLPELQFDQVLRVRTNLTIDPAVGDGITRKQVSFVFECFGEVARVVSEDDETEENFTTAVEFRRLGF